MSFLKHDKPMTQSDMVKEFLAIFLTEGDKFNGTNLWLGNIYDDNLRLIFAHNQEAEEKFKVIENMDSVAFSNGRISEEWFK